MKRMTLVLCSILLLVVCARAQKRSEIKLTATSHSATIWWTPATVPSGAPPVTAVSIYRGTTSGGETSLAANVALTALPACPTAAPAGDQCYIDATVTPGMTYYYEVSASNSSGESPKSSEWNAGAIPNNVPPNAPTNLGGSVQ